MVNGLGSYGNVFRKKVLCYVNGINFGWNSWGRAMFSAECYGCMKMGILEICARQSGG
jgi:hypothetical protein